MTPPDFPALGPLPLFNPAPQAALIPQGDAGCPLAAERAPAPLDHLETSRCTVSLPPVFPPTNPEQDLCEAFRHSGWHQKRQAIARALQSAGVSQERFSRFASCGWNAWVLSSGGDNPRYRLACDLCHDRFCDACQAERRRLVTANLATRLMERFHVTDSREPLKNRIRFLTLTLKASHTPLSDQIDRLYGCWTNLRGDSAVSPQLKGGVAFLELTRNQKMGTWHPHLHVLVEGGYIPQDQLRTEWLRITGDSFIVDIRRIRSIAEAAGYVAKYATKGMNATVWNDKEALTEAIHALKGRRMFATFGTWSRFGLSKRPDEVIDWRPVGRLADLIERARGGDPTARDILRILRRSDADAPIESGTEHASSPPLPDLLS